MTDYHLFSEDGLFLETGAQHRHNRDLDTFLLRAYNYFLGKGFMCIALSRTLNLISLLWVVFLVVVVTSWINYEALFSNYNFDNAFQPHSGLHPLLAVSLVIFFVFWLWQAVQFVIDTRDNWEIYRFYAKELHISESELQTIEWSEVARRIITIRRVCITKEQMTPLDLVNRIMRKDNYLIAMINKDVLKMNIPMSHHVIVTKILEWTVSSTIFGFVFDPMNQDGINPHVKDPNRTRELAEGLRKRFKIMGLITLVLSPFIFIFLLIYFLFQYGEQLRSRPTTFATRQWSPLARWKLREFNELPHIFQKRLSVS